MIEMQMSSLCQFCCAVRSTCYSIQTIAIKANRFAFDAWFIACTIRVNTFTLIQGVSLFVDFIKNYLMAVDQNTIKILEMAEMNGV